MIKFTRCLLVLSIGVIALAGTPTPAAETPTQVCPATAEATSDAFELSLEVATKAFCSADCQGAGSASCSGPTCTAVNRNCAVGQPGYARCGKTTFFCSPCPGPVCSPPCNIQCGETDGLCLSNGTCACY